jgi:hypothetical protein
MKVAHGVARASGALVLAIGMTLGVGTTVGVAGATAAVGGVIRVQAYVDGRSQLILQGDTAQWHHFDYAAPGREGFINLPTTINGTDWYPQWPDIPDAENRFCNCYSDVYTGVDPPVPQTDVVVSLTLVQALGPVSIVQAPSLANDYTLVVQFNDYAPPGAHWYIVDININAPSAGQLSLGFYQGPQGAKTLAYSNSGALASGHFDVSPATGHLKSVHGTGTLPSSSGNGDATMSFDLAYDGVAKTWSGTVVVSDPGAGFSANVPIHAGPRAIVRNGSAIDGVIFNIKALSVPRKCFEIIFTLDTIGELA